MLDFRDEFLFLECLLVGCFPDVLLKDFDSFAEALF